LFILIWNGFGILALGVIVPALVLYGFFARRGQHGLGFLAAGVTLLVGGVGCVFLGREWNREGTQHSLYGIPLQGWGYAYLPFGLMFAVVGAHEIFRKMG
jgi:hypothetical protein